MRETEDAVAKICCIGQRRLVWAWPAVIFYYVFKSLSLLAVGQKWSPYITGFVKHRKCIYISRVVSILQVTWLISPFRRAFEHCILVSRIVSRSWIVSCHDDQTSIFMFYIIINIILLMLLIVKFHCFNFNKKFNFFKIDFFIVDIDF